MKNLPDILGNGGIIIDTDEWEIVVGELESQDTALREMMNYASDMDEIVVYCFDEGTYNTYIETFRRLKGIR